MANGLIIKNYKSLSKTKLTSPRMKLSMMFWKTGPHAQPFILQVKFLKCDKQVVFQPHLKYLKITLLVAIEMTVNAMEKT